MAKIHRINYDELTEKYKDANLTLEELAILFKPSISPLPEIEGDDFDSEDEQTLFKYRIVLKLFYRETYNPSKNEDVLVSCEDPDCFCFSKENFDIDKFMKYNDNYIGFIESVMTWYDSDEDLFEYIKDFEYTGDKISFTLHSKEKLDEDDIKREILRQSFEDGMYESPPGSEGVIALNQKDETTFEHIELGLIDCRDENCVRVKRIK
jgi:hypothetical protein